MKKIVMLAAVASFALSTNAMAQDGKAVYEKACKTCHSIGLAGAPKFQNAADWAPRFEKGMDAMLKSVNNGMNAMPSKGACIDCSDEDYKAAINYMAGK
ncbi:c-type cytochrome [Ferrimonas lipolytica]|uniref:Cytochrome c5 family protein n=1 Tax=Ferrimonas lipolytica TaxID=2724191 RepID=A0A6H1UIN4_9GAMM|nr:c-type cytochrome [Ferrimonas lipolytica]QIZ78489.1 cytochrome c5 family protein [Ferrimonas lipolytica]